MAAPKYSKKKLIRESIRLFYENGYQDTTMRKIATAAGISHPAIFMHFKNKAEIGTLIMYRYIHGVGRLTRRYTRDHGIDMKTNHEPLVFYWTINFLLMKEDVRLFNFSREFYASQDIFESDFNEAFFQMFLDVWGDARNRTREDLTLQTQLITSVGSILSFNCFSGTISLEKAVMEHFNLLYSILKIRRRISKKEIELFLAEKKYESYLDFDLLEDILLTDFGKEYPHPPAPLL